MLLIHLANLALNRYHLLSGEHIINRVDLPLKLPIEISLPQVLPIELLLKGNVVVHRFAL